MPSSSAPRSAKVALCALVFISWMTGSHAQPSAVPSPVELRFDVARFIVEGNTLLPAEAIERIVSGFAGKQRDFGDVQRALEALENAYRARGYSAVQVFLPEQQLESGEVRLQVIEARINKLEIRGNKFFSDANVIASLPALAKGSTPNANEVSKNLRLVNESPAKQTNVTLRAGEREGDVDVVVELVEENPKKWFVTLDNTGTGVTGYDRIGIGYQNANLFDRDHAITLQFVTSLEKPKQVGIYSVGYHVPLYAHGASMDFVAGYSDVDAGTTATPSGPLTFSGRGGVLGVRYNRPLERIDNYDHRLTFGADHKMYRNACALGEFGAAGCGAAGATFSLTPVSLTYSGTWRQEAGQLGLNASVAANLGGGAYGNTDALGLARFGAKARYQVYRAGANWARSMEGDWQARVRFDLQHTEDVLVPPEQFGIGGQQSVRGFQERERADDRGHTASVELYTPELAPTLGWSDWNLRLLAFYDIGRTSRVNPLPGETVHSGIASAGAGFRLARQPGFSLRFDLAQIVHAGGTRERGHWRFGFASVASF